MSDPKPTLESQLAECVELGWSPCLRLVAGRWFASAGKYGSGAYLSESAETPGEAMALLLAQIKAWTP